MASHWRLWSGIKENRDLPAINALVNIVRTAFVLILGLIGLRWTQSNHVIPGYEYRDAISAGIVALICVSVLIIYVRFKRRQTSRRSHWNPDIWVKSRRQVCEVTSKLAHSAHHHIDIVAMADNVASFALYVEWSGSREIEFECHNEGFNVVKSHVPGSNMTNYRIIFDYVRQKGEEISLEYTVSAITYIEESSDYFSHTFTDEKIPESAVMEVHFPKGQDVKNVTWQIHCPPNAHSPVLEPEKLKPVGGIVSKSYKPSSGSRYSISWDYVD